MVTLALFVALFSFPAMAEAPVRAECESSSCATEQNLASFLDKNCSLYHLDKNTKDCRYFVPPDNLFQYKINAARTLTRFNWTRITEDGVQPLFSFFQNSSQQATTDGFLDTHIATHKLVLQKKVVHYLADGQSPLNCILEYFKKNNLIQLLDAQKSISARRLDFLKKATTLKASPPPVRPALPSHLGTFVAQGRVVVGSLDTGYYTFGLAPCIGLVIVNKRTAKVAMAHIDPNYSSTATAMIKDMGTDPNDLEVSLIGGYQSMSVPAIAHILDELDQIGVSPKTIDVMGQDQGARGFYVEAKTGKVIKLTEQQQSTVRDRFWKK